MDTDQLTTDATIAAGVVGGGLFLAEKAGNSKAKRLRERFETKHDQFIQWQKKYPKLMWWFGELNAIVDAALGFGDLTTDILTSNTVSSFTSSLSTINSLFFAFEKD